MSKSESAPPADRPIETAEQAASDALVLAFGRLQGAASRLGYLLGGAIEKEFGITHLMYEVLLILGRSGETGMAMRAIAQERVLTTGGVTRLIDRMEQKNLLKRLPFAGDGRGQLVAITDQGQDLLRRMWPTYRASLQDHVGSKLNDSDMAKLAALLQHLL
jgi:DNA-binding MarR family transcriptional regulator